MARTTIDPAALRRALARPDGVRAVGAAARDLAAEARTRTPRRTGAAQDSLESTAGMVDGQAVGRAYSTSPLFTLLEFGTSRTPTFAPLRTAADALGLRRARR